VRNLKKGEPPSLLKEQADNWLKEFLTDQKNDTKRTRYRAPEIKEALTRETSWKCVYCESRIGHNTPGDIEHMVPSSKVAKLHFEWTNLTTACSECNRRKNNYYEKVAEFLNPYVDDVEALVEHHGPFVGYAPGSARAEITLRILQFERPERQVLVYQKLNHLEDLQHLLSRYESEINPVLKELLRLELEERRSISAEYSAMSRSFLRDRVSISKDDTA
jgi:5-methylcytosine-specific restriction endonuclease McrA